MSNGEQWFAIVDSEGNLVSVGTEIANPLPPGLRAVTIDGPGNGRYWDKFKLMWVDTPPPDHPQVLECAPTCSCRTVAPPPPKVDPYPYKQDWGVVNLIFDAADRYAKTYVTFRPGMFDVAPIVTGLSVSTPNIARGDSYIDLQATEVTKSGFYIYGRLPRAVSYSEKISWQAVQRKKDSA